MKQLLGSILALFTGVFVGMFATEYMSVRWATTIGFTAFILVALMTYPRTKVNE
ncbi:MAG: hypothetical protein WCP15_04290 [bacterium]